MTRRNRSANLAVLSENGVLLLGSERWSVVGKGELAAGAKDGQIRRSNACFWFQPAWQANLLTGVGAFRNGMTLLEGTVAGKTSEVLFTDRYNNATIELANGSGGEGFTGLSWLAIGF